MKKIILLCTLIFTINSFHALNCMDPSSWLAKRRSGHSAETFNNKKPATQLRKSASMPDLHESKETQSQNPFINAVCNENNLMIEFYLKDPYFNPNVQDSITFNTALHCAAAQRNIHLVNTLLQDHRIDASIRNRKQQMTREVFSNRDPKNPTAEEVHVRTIMFARITLDTIVKEQVQRLRDIYFSNIMSPETLDAVVKMVKDKFLLFQTKQHGDQAIPEAALLPNYATDDFIKNMVRFRMHNTNK